MCWWNRRLHIWTTVACHDAALLRGLEIARRTRVTFHVAGKISIDLPLCSICSRGPRVSSEASDLEASLLPLSSGLAGSIESAKTCIDGTLVSLWTEFGRSWCNTAGEDFSVLSSVIKVSILWTGTVGRCCCESQRCPAHERF